MMNTQEIPTPEAAIKATHKRERDEVRQRGIKARDDHDDRKRIQFLRELAAWNNKYVTSDPVETDLKRKVVARLRSDAQELEDLLS